MTPLQLIDLSLAVSAGLRMLTGWACFSGCMKLAPKATNYPIGPMYVRAALLIFGGGVIASSSELIARAISTHPPSPFLTGYLLTFAELMLSAALYVWLETKWKPADAQRRAAREENFWLAIAPCVRRRRILKERQRNTTRDAQIPHRVVAPDASPRAFRKARLAMFASHWPPATHDVDSVIPEALRDAD